LDVNAAALTWVGGTNETTETPKGTLGRKTVGMECNVGGPL